jgi:ABC-type multidrug transport system fused ATPase/permease subunit
MFLRSPFARLRRTWRKRRQELLAYARTATRFAPFILPRRRRLGLILALGLAYTAVGLLEPWFLKLIFDNVLLDRPLTGIGRLLAPLASSRLSLLNAIIAGLVLTAVIRGIVYYYQRLLTSRVGQQIAADIRLDLYSHLQRLSFGFHERRRTGDMLARLTTDVRVLRDIFISLPLSIASEVFLVVGMVVVMALLDWRLTLVALAVLPVLGLLLRNYQSPMKGAARRQREREGQIASLATETLGAIKVVQGFRREDYEIERFKTQNKGSLRSGLRAARLEARLRWSSEVAVAIVMAAVLSVAVRRVLDGALSPGDLLVFVAYLRAFNRPLRRVSGMAQRAAHGSAAGDRVLEMLALVPAIVDRPNAVDAPRFEGHIEFHNATFAHKPGRPAAVRTVSLSIAAGERVALIGPTGAGKSTLASLVPRFYDVQDGRVTIDGRDVRDFTLESLRRQIGFVFQEPVLFSTTIAENIAYGRPDATRQHIEDAARQAGIHDIIAALPDGYETVLGERGGTISGGQRQCVAIARAIVRDARIVILDEPTAGLDNQSAAIVVRALDRLMEGRTVLFISHQLFSVRHFDRVIVIRDGEVVEQGPHEELTRRDGPYRSLELAASRSVAR